MAALDGLRMRMRGAALVALLCGSVAIAPPTAVAAETTRCHVGGPAGTAKVVRLDLRESGSEFVNISLPGRRSLRPASGHESWHLAQGLIVIDEPTGEIVAHRISNEGSNPRRVVVEHDGSRADADVVGPDAPFAHSSLQLPSGLPASTYLVVAFGSDGDAALPNDGFGGFVEVSGAHRCDLAGAVTVFDIDHTDFSGGTQLSVPGAAIIRGAQLTRRLEGDLVVGLIDASVQAVGDIHLAHSAPAGDREVSDDIVPFASPGGDFTWTASTHGVAPVVAIVGVAIRLD